MIILSMQLQVGIVCSIFYKFGFMTVDEISLK